MSYRKYWKKPIMDSKKLSFYMAYFLPFGKALDTIIPSLPRVRGSLLQRHPWTPWTYGILSFCNDRDNNSKKGETYHESRLV
jgi:hypothetical protein